MMLFMIFLRAGIVPSLATRLLAAGRMSVLAAEHLAIAFGGVRAVDDVSFAVAPGEVFAIIGPNGAGKTTLFNLHLRPLPAERGRVRLAGEDVTGAAPQQLARRGLSRTFQNLQIFFRMSALENVMVGRHRHERPRCSPTCSHLPAVARQNRATRDAARRSCSRVVGPAAAGRPRRPARCPTARSSGSRSRARWRREPKVLLLDEPAAGCNAGRDRRDRRRHPQHRARSGVTVVLVEHDMRLVMNVSDRILVLDQRPHARRGHAPPRCAPTRR